MNIEIYEYDCYFLLRIFWIFLLWKIQFPVQDMFIPVLNQKNGLKYCPKIIGGLLKWRADTPCQIVHFVQFLIMSKTETVTSRPDPLSSLGRLDGAPCIQFSDLLEYWCSHWLSKVWLHKKWSFPLRISSVNVTESAVFLGFGHIYWRNP